MTATSFYVILHMPSPPQVFLKQDSLHRTTLPPLPAMLVVVELFVFFPTLGDDYFLYTRILNPRTRTYIHAYVQTSGTEQYRGD